MPNYQVSISALSDRGLLLDLGAVHAGQQRCFNIRSFGSWIASIAMYGTVPSPPNVSISALSDRGLLPPRRRPMSRRGTCFNIRSFGSWIASALNPQGA